MRALGVHVDPTHDHHGVAVAIAQLGAFLDELQHAGSTGLRPPPARSFSCGQHLADMYRSRVVEVLLDVEVALGETIAPPAPARRPTEIVRIEVISGGGEGGRRDRLRVGLANRSQEREYMPGLDREREVVGWARPKVVVRLDGVHYPDRTYEFTASHARRGLAS